MTHILVFIPSPFILSVSILAQYFLHRLYLQDAMTRLIR